MTTDLNTKVTNLPSTVRQTTFGDETIQKEQIARFKGKQDETVRMAIIDPSLVIAGRAHYDEKVKFVMCQTVYESKHGVEMVVGEPASCCTLLKPASRKIVTLAVHYDTNPRGQLQKPLSLTFKVWRMNEDVFDQLRTIHTEGGGLDKVDLLVKCTDEKYQDLTVTPVPQRVIADPQVLEKYGDNLRMFVELAKKTLANNMGKTMTEADLRKELGGAVTAAPTKMETASAENIADLLS